MPPLTKCIDKMYGLERNMSRRSGTLHYLFKQIGSWQLLVNMGFEAGNCLFLSNFISSYNHV